MDSKEYLNIVVRLRTINIRYQSNVSEEDLLVVKSFLTLLRKNALLIDSESNLAGIDYKLRIQECVELCTNDEIENPYSLTNNEIKDLYYRYIKSILDRVRKLYIGPLYEIYLNISDNFIQNHTEEFFDKQIQTAFASKAILGSDSMQPQELTTILNSFCDTQNTKEYYNPFAGLASLALKLPEHINYRGEEVNEKTWLLGKLRMLVYNCPPYFDYQLADSIEKWTFPTGKQYDFISFNPPFNIKLDPTNLPFLNKSSYGYSGNANSLIISHCFELLKPGGKMSFVMTSGFLFSANSKDKQLKKELVENGHVEKIIALPGQILNHTGIAVNIIVLSKSNDPQTEIEFIDATEKFEKADGKLHTIQLNETLQLIADDTSKLKRKVGIKEIVSNDYNLSVHRYVFEDLGFTIEEKELLVKLKNLVKPISRKRSQSTKGKFIRIRDLSDNAVSYSKSFNDLEEVELKPNASLLENDSLLLATTWKSLKPTLFEGVATNVFYDSNSILACKVVESRIDKEYLILELQKEYVQNQIEQRRTGTTVSRITLKDFFEVEIIVPPLDVQNKKKYSYKEAIINNQQSKLKELMLEYGIDVADENSFLRHKIAGTLKNLRGSFSKLRQIIEQQVIQDLPELYNYKANPKLDSNFLDYLNRMDRDLNSIHNSVKAVGVELNLQEIKLERINFIKFITDYTEEIRSRTSNSFEIKITVDKEMLKEHKIKEVIVLGDRDFLHQVFNNIIENAERHAFNDSKLVEKRIEIELLYDLENLEVQLDFTNTGKPLPEDYSFEAFTRKGSNAGSNSGNGIGGWFINEVMKKHNGKLDLTDETGPEGIEGDSATTIELIFPIEIKI